MKHTHDVDRFTLLVGWLAGYLFTVGYVTASGWELLPLLVFWPLVLGSAVGSNLR